MDVLQVDREIYKLCSGRAVAWLQLVLYRNVGQFLLIATAAAAVKLREREGWHCHGEKTPVDIMINI